MKDDAIKTHVLNLVLDKVWTVQKIFEPLNFFLLNIYIYSNKL